MGRVIAAAFVTICLLMTGSAYAGCDAASLAKVDRLLDEMASKSEKDDSVYYSWRDNWHNLTVPQKEGMIRLVADTDTCHTGRARKIFIHYRGELVAKADPTWGIKVIK